jgi:hypothetical protein
VRVAVLLTADAGPWDELVDFPNPFPKEPKTPTSNTYGLVRKKLAATWLILICVREQGFVGQPRTKNVSHARGQPKDRFGWQYVQPSVSEK